MEINTSYYQLLRLEVWKKAIGNDHIAKGNHYYELIRKKIKAETDFNLSKDTIRNFLEAKHIPQPKPLDIYSTYVLGGDKMEPKTFKDFQNWYAQKPLLDRLGKFFTASKYRFWVILGTLGIIIFLISIVLLNQKSSFPAFEIIKSNDSAVSATNAQYLEEVIPQSGVIVKYFKNFKFDNNQFVNKKEGQKMMEWLGIREMKYYADEGESHFTGYLKSGCKITLWVNPKQKNHVYRMFCNSNTSDMEFPPFFTEIPKPRETEEFFTRFYNSDIEELEQKGWSLFNDSINLNLWNDPQYRNSGYLTLHTYLGDSFIDDKGVDPKVINILSHQIVCGSCCEITLKIVDFNPYQRYQQAGLFLFYNETPFPSLRYNFQGIENDVNRVHAIKRNDKYSNVGLIPPNERSIISEIDGFEVKNPIDSITLKIIVEDYEYSFLRKVNNEKEFITVRSVSMNLLGPVYVGISAFQGRPDIPFPSYDIAPVIPVHFEYFEVKSCK